LLYFFSPTAAAVVAVVVLAGSICLIPWAVRLLHFGYSILLDPLLTRVSLARAAKSFRQTADEQVVSVASLSARSFQKRQRVTCVCSPGGIRLEARSVFGQAIRRPMASAGETIRLGRAVGWVEIQVVNSDGRILDRFALSRVHITPLTGSARPSGPTIVATLAPCGSCVA
jgi:hypothetical protein